MAICIDCIHGDVCRNAYTLKVEPPNVCGCFKNKTDVVEVVRCKDCKHYTDNMNEDNLWKGYCGKAISCFEFRKSTDFCSYGERKENEIHKQSDTKKVMETVLKSMIKW